MLFISPGTCRWPTVCQALSFGDAWCHRGGSRGLVSHSLVSCWELWAMLEANWSQGVGDGY